VPPALAHQLHDLGVQVFRHAFLLAMKPSLSLSIIALALGAGTTLLMRSNPPTSAGRERAAGLAAAGE
jgi:hypothetical protein